MTKITLGEFERICGENSKLRLIVDSDDQEGVSGVGYNIEFNRVDVMYQPNVIYFGGCAAELQLYSVNEVIYDDDISLMGNKAFYITYGAKKNSKKNKRICLLMRSGI